MSDQKVYAIKMSWGWSHLHTPKSPSIVLGRSVQIAGAVTREGDPVNVSAFKISRSKKALKEGMENVVYCLGPTEREGVYTLVDF